MKKYLRYEHHGNLVWADRRLIGNHRDVCLCYDCLSFIKEDREKNCPIANRVYELCVEEHLVLPVWECPAFVARTIYK